MVIFKHCVEFTLTVPKFIFHSKSKNAENVQILHVNYIERWINARDQEILLQTKPVQSILLCFDCYTYHITNLILSIYLSLDSKFQRAIYKNFLKMRRKCSMCREKIVMVLLAQARKFDCVVMHGGFAAGHLPLTRLGS